MAVTGPEESLESLESQVMGLVDLVTPALLWGQTLILYVFFFLMHVSIWLWLYTIDWYHHLLHQGPPGIKGQKGEPVFVTDGSVSVRLSESFSVCVSSCFFFNVNYNLNVPLHSIGASCFLIGLMTYLLKLALKNLCRKCTDKPKRISLNCYL